MGSLNQQYLNFDSIEVLSKSQQQKVTGGTTKWCCKESAPGFPPVTTTCYSVDDKQVAQRSCEKSVHYSGSTVSCYQVGEHETCN